jgi:purine catabolism regulator
MTSVAELVADPVLRLHVAAGRRGLDREVTAAAVSELTEPGPWLQGGELLLTIGLLLHRYEDYVAHLDAAGVPALGLGLGAGLRHQTVPEALAVACEAVGMPLLAVPDGVPFIAVTKAVFALRARAERKHLERALATQRALTAAAVSPGGLGGILAAHGRATGGDAVVVDLLGRPLAGGPARLVDELAGLTAQVRAQGLLGAGVDIDGERRREVHPLGSRRLRALLLLDGPASGSQVTSALVSLLSLELERHFGLGAAERRGRAQLLAHLARGTVDDAVAARRLTAAGLPERELRAAVVATEQPADPTADRAGDRGVASGAVADREAAAGAEATDLAADLTAALPDALVRVVGDLVELAAPAAVDLDAALAVLAAGRPAGIGIAVRPGALAVSLRQARSALPESRVRGRPVHVIDLAGARMLLATMEADRLRTYADAVLGHLDADPRADELLRALAAFCEHNGHWERTAEALGVHRHTVRHRIEAVEQRTGRRLAVAQDRHELWLALRARDLL